MSHRVLKLWGEEVWLRNDDKYCVKLLHLNPGFQSSLHFHKRKAETFVVVQGKVMLEVIRGYRTGEHSTHTIHLIPFQHHTLAPFTPHRFWAVHGDATIVEASTKHDDRDVVRLEESRAVS